MQLQTISKMHLISTKTKKLFSAQNRKKKKYRNIKENKTNNPFDTKIQPVQQLISSTFDAFAAAVALAAKTFLVFRLKILFSI